MTTSTGEIVLSTYVSESGYVNYAIGFKPNDDQSGGTNLGQSGIVTIDESNPQHSYYKELFKVRDDNYGDSDIDGNLFTDFDSAFKRVGDSFTVDAKKAEEIGTPAKSCVYPKIRLSLYKKNLTSTTPLS